MPRRAPPAVCLLAVILGVACARAATGPSNAADAVPTTDQRVADLVGLLEDAEALAPGTRDLLLARVWLASVRSPAASVPVASSWDGTPADLARPGVLPDPVRLVTTSPPPTPAREKAEELVANWPDVVALRTWDTRDPWTLAPWAARPGDPDDALPTAAQDVEARVVLVERVTRALARLGWGSFPHDAPETDARLAEALVHAEAARRALPEDPEAWLWTGVARGMARGSDAMDRYFHGQDEDLGLTFTDRWRADSPWSARALMSGALDRAEAAARRARLAVPRAPEEAQAAEAVADAAAAWIVDVEALGATLAGTGGHTRDGLHALVPRRPDPYDDPDPRDEALAHARARWSPAALSTGMPVLPSAGPTWHFAWPPDLALVEHGTSSTQDHLAGTALHTTTEMPLTLRAAGNGLDVHVGASTWTASRTGPAGEDLTVEPLDLALLALTFEVPYVLRRAADGTVTGIADGAEALHRVRDRQEALAAELEGAAPDAVRGFRRVSAPDRHLELLRHLADKEARTLATAWVGAPLAVGAQRTFTVEEMDPLEGRPMPFSATGGPVAEVPCAPDGPQDCVRIEVVAVPVPSHVQQLLATWTPVGPVPEDAPRARPVVQAEVRTVAVLRPATLQPWSVERTIRTRVARADASGRHVWQVDRTLTSHGTLGWSEARTVPPVDRPPSVAVAAIPGGRVHLPPPTDGRGRAQPGAEGLDRDVAPFLLATHELRRDQWASWLPTRPWVTDDPEGGCGGARPRHPGMGVLDLLDDDRPSPAAGSGDDLPATCISFAEAAWVANLLSRRDGLRPAYRIADGEVTWDRRADGWRLPTEAEWLQALAADPTLLPPPDDPGACARANLAEPRGWRAKDAPPPCEDGYAGPSPVGTFPPSAQGIHDLVGNVAEWVWGDRATLDEPDHLRPHAAFAKGPTHASRGWGRARDERAFLGGQRSSVVGLRFARSAEGAR